MMDEHKKDHSRIEMFDRNINRKLYWVILDPEYMDYLKTIDANVPNYDYGNEHIKPFYGPLISNNGICYVAGVSHYIPDKHDKIPANLTLQKIYDHEFQKMIAVSNLRYMFPVPESCIQRLDYRNIDDHVVFRSQRERYNQVNLLKKILNALNDSGLQKRALQIKEMQFHGVKNYLINSCLDFKRLEAAAQRYAAESIDYQEQDITDMVDDHIGETQFIKL